MTEKLTKQYVALPCSDSELWAIPQNCLAEIVTVHSDDELPPGSISWRGLEVPVLDLDEGGNAPWREHHGGTGLIAVILGLEGEGCDYWGVALRGIGLGIVQIGDQQVDDLPDLALQRSMGAFRLQDIVYQVPDLAVLQQQVISMPARSV